MSHLLKITVALLLLGGLTLQAGFAQRTGNSPYSRYGLGEIAFPGFAPNQAMGSTGTSFANGIFINNVNPALLARNRSTTLEAGVYGQWRFLKTTQARQQEPEGNLNYVGLAFPLLKPNINTGVQKVKWTTGITLAPYSSTNYSVESAGQVTGDTAIARINYQGTGGLTGVSFSNGFNFSKKFYVGLQATYLFGVVTNESTTEIFTPSGIRFPGAYDINYQQRYNYSGFAFKPGFAYRDTLSKNLLLTIGGTVDLPTQLKARRVDQFVTLQNVGQTEQTPLDTAAIGEDVKGKVNLPATYRLGVTVDRPFQWAVSADVAYQQWSNFQHFGANNNLKNTLALSLGGEWTPNINSINRYLSRTTYRAGFQYAQMPVSNGGNQLKDMSVSAGVFFPITPPDRRTLSYLNVSFTAGQRGTLDNNQVRERYIRMTLGFTLNDFGWFIPRRID